MKRRINRETAIGLSVLLLLLVILVGVAIRRFMRPTLPPEAIAAREEAKHEEEHLEHRAKQEMQTQKPDLLTPVATENHDRLQALDDPGHWGHAAKERRKETPTSSPDGGPTASDPPITPGSPEGAMLHKHEGERTSTFGPPQLPPATGDDRYSVAANGPSSERRRLDNAGPAALPSNPSPAAEYRGGRGESRLAAGSSPEDSRGMATVIQVSGGDSSDTAARPLEQYDRHRDRPDPVGFGGRAADAMPPAPIVDQPPVSPYGPTTGLADPDAARRHAERPREREFQAIGPPVDAAAPRSANIIEPPRNASTYVPTSPQGGNMPSYSALAAGDAGPGYAASQGGYAPERQPRRGGEFRESVRAQVPLRDDGLYEVQPNDSCWTISERVYGSGAYFRALAEQNRGKAARPDRLPPGLMISTPAIARLEKDYPDLCPRPERRDTVRNRAAGVNMAATAGGGRSYVVQEGDTLSSIARNELGKVSRWAEVYQLNREALGKDYDYLTPGMRLVLPIRDSQSGDRTTRRDDSGAPLIR